MCISLIFSRRHNVRISLPSIEILQQQKCLHAEMTDICSSWRFWRAFLPMRFRWGIALRLDGFSAQKMMIFSRRGENSGIGSKSTSLIVVRPNGAKAASGQRGENKKKWLGGNCLGGEMGLKFLGYKMIDICINVKGRRFVAGQR